MNPDNIPAEKGEREVDFSKSTRLLLELKDTSELMVDLAYSALLYDNEDIADEVFSMEEIADDLEREVQLSAIEDLIEHEDSKKTYVIIRLADAMEKIADAAVLIADVVLRDFERNPIMCMSLRDSRVTITSVTVTKSSMLENKSLGDARVASQSGMWIIAIKRDKRHIYGPNENTVIRKGDTLIARGPKEGQPLLRKMAGA